jgi:hypothetical protein
MEIKFLLVVCKYSGPSKEIHTKANHNGQHSIDYVSKPDYQFEYGVEDPKSKVSQFRKENRQDDAVVGEYSYTDPLGHVRTVKYTADKIHGFRAEIYVDGKLENPTLPQAPKTSATTAHAAVSEDVGDGGLSENSSSHYHDSRDYSSNEDY